MTTSLSPTTLYNEIAENEGADVLPENYRAVLISANGWQASSCDCNVFATSVLWGLIDWLDLCCGFAKHIKDSLRLTCTKA